MLVNGVAFYGTNNALVNAKKFRRSVFIISVLRMNQIRINANKGM